MRVVAAGDGNGEEENKEGDREGGDWKWLIGCHAQKHLEGWYSTLGHMRDKGMSEWEEDGIPHVGMWRVWKFNGWGGNHMSKRAQIESAGAQRVNRSRWKKYILCF